MNMNGRKRRSLKGNVLDKNTLKDLANSEMGLSPEMSKDLYAGLQALAMQCKPLENRGLSNECEEEIIMSSWANLRGFMNCSSSRWEEEDISHHPISSFAHAFTR